MANQEFHGLNTLPVNMESTRIKSDMKHQVVNHHQRQFVDDDNPEIHTNTIEGFWSLLKRAWYGTHHHYNKRYAHLYVAEACWKYNHRHSDDIFMDFMQEVF